jgi:integrase
MSARNSRAPTSARPPDASRRRPRPRCATSRSFPSSPACSTTQAAEPIRARRRLGVRDRPRHPLRRRNVSRRAPGRAAQLAGLNEDGWPSLRFHDLRHTFASHLIIDLGLDPAQVSRVLGRARITIRLDIYTHLFEDARHARDIRTRMAASPFAGLLEPTTAAPGATVLKLR